MYPLVCRNGNCRPCLLDWHCPWPSPNSYWEVLADPSDAAIAKCSTSAYSMHRLIRPAEWLRKIPLHRKISSSFPLSHTLKHVKNAFYFGGRGSVCIYLILQQTFDISTSVIILHLRKLISENFNVLPKPHSQ